jgi:group I intron endonuclease
MKLPKYNNAEICKDKILLENKNKSGIYKFTNLINGKRYIGSSENLSNRLSFYYSPFKINSALQQSKSYICSAIIKYGLKYFSLEILEYCEPSKLLIREKYYIDLGAEYNIIKNPTIPPMSGRQHSDETKTIMSDARKGENNPMYGKNHTEETKTIMSDAKKGENNPMYNQPKPEGADKPSQQIEVFDMAKRKRR